MPIQSGLNLAIYDSNFTDNNAIFEGGGINVKGINKADLKNNKFI